MLCWRKYNVKANFEKDELCQKLQENWRYILESKNDKCKNKPQEECKPEDGCVFDGGEWRCLTLLKTKGT